MADRASLSRESAVARIESLNETAWALRISETKQALEHSKDAVRLARRHRYPAGRAHALRNLAACLSELGNYAESLKEATAALRLFEKLPFPSDRLTDKTQGKADTLTLIGTAHYRLNQYDDALSAYSDAAKLYRQLGDTPGESAIASHIGNLHLLQSHYEQSLSHFLTSLRLIENTGDRVNREREARTLNNIGNVYYYLGDFQTALDYFFKSLRIKEDIGYTRGKANAFSNIANVYEQLGDFETALAYHHQALTIYTAAGDKQGETLALNNIGTNHEKGGRFAEAIPFFSKSLSLSEQSGNQSSLGIAAHNLGCVYSRLGKTAQAQTYLVRALDVRRQIRDRRGEADSLLELGKLSLSEEKSDRDFGKLNDRDFGKLNASAIESLSQALAIGEELGAKALIYEAHESLAACYEAKGDTAQAIHHYRNFHTVQQQVFGEKNMLSIRRLQASFNIQQAEREREVYRLKAERLELEMAQQENALRSLSLSLVQKNESLHRIRREAKELEKELTNTLKTSVRQLLQTVERCLDSREEWKTFEAQFSEGYQTFTHTLSEKFPSLTPTELKICALLKINLTNKDIAQLLVTSVRNIEGHRYRLRKKFKLSAEANFISFLASL